MDRATNTSDPKLAEIVRRLVAAFQPERIYLFGSRARGEVGPDSDYDLMMVLSRLPGLAYRVAQDAHTLLWDLDVSADVLPLSREEFERRIEVKSSLPAIVLREGALLHAA